MSAVTEHEDDALHERGQFQSGLGGGVVGWAAYQDAANEEEEARNEGERLARNPASAVRDRTVEIVDIGTVAGEVVEGLIEGTERREPGETENKID